MSAILYTVFGVTVLILIVSTVWASCVMGHKNKLAEALKDIVQFAKDNPGCGYSCGKKAEKALKEKGE